MFLVFTQQFSNTRYDIIKGHSPTVGYPVGSIARMEKEDVTQLQFQPTYKGNNCLATVLTNYHV